MNSIERVNKMIELRRLSIDDGIDVYNLLQDIPKVENGYNNSANGLSYEEYKQWLVKKHNDSLQEGLVDGWRVPQTTYFLYVDNVPVGSGSVRHFLTDALLKVGGHIGYTISPKYRGKGYGKEILRLLLIEAKRLGIDKALVTANVDNFRSQRVALANGGVMTDKDSGHVRIWIDNK